MDVTEKIGAQAPEKETEVKCVRTKGAFADSGWALVEGIGADDGELERIVARKEAEGKKAKAARCPKSLYVLRVEKEEDSSGLRVVETVAEGVSAEEAKGRLSEDAEVVCAERVPWIRRNAVVAAIAGVALVGAIGIGAAVALQPAPQPAVEPAPQPAVEQKAEEVFSAAAKARIDAEGWTEEGVPAGLKASCDVSQASDEVVEALEKAGFERVEGDDGAMAKAFEGVACNADVELGELPEGVYEVSVDKAPVAADGSSYKAPEEPASLEVKEGLEPSVEIALERTAFEDLSAEERDAAIASLEAAGKAEAVEALGEKADELAKADEKDSAGEGGEASSGEGSSSGTAGGSSGAASGSTGGSSSGSSGSTGGSSSGSGSGSSGSTGGGSTAPQQHVHSWTTVVDTPAWSERVPSGVIVHCVCGANFDSQAAANQHTANAPWDEPHNTWVETIYSTVEHPAVTHQECTGCGARG